MRNVKKTRKFGKSGGKTYRLHDWYTSKFVASVAAKNLKALGYSVRITLRPKSKAGGYPLMDLWYVWKRKK